MDLREIVRTIGGDLLAGGRQANIPAPGHSPSDRSVSLKVTPRGRLLVHCFAGDDWRSVLDDLRSRGLIDGQNQLASGPTGQGACRSSPTEDLPRAQKVRIAADLWHSGRPIMSTLAERYVYRRGVRRPMADQSVVRFKGYTPIGVYENSSRTMPAMLVAIRDGAGEVTAVEITYLDALGQRTTRLRAPRKIVGSVTAGSAIRIDPPAESMLVAEGYFTALSASEQFKLPAWALMSTSNLRHWTAPPNVRELLIAADRGQDGEASAERLRERHRALGIDATIRMPPDGFGDWNEAMAPEEG